MKYIEALLTPNKWSRPQHRPVEWRFIVLHWFLAPGQPARHARTWWESRKSGTRGYGSAHVIVGEKGALLCVPFDEIGYHVGTMTPTKWALENIPGNGNFYCLGIEMEHRDMTGEPTPTVWATAVEVARDMCDQFDIPPANIITHYDITGMQKKWGGYPCHRWFVDRPEEMLRFQEEVAKRK